MKASDMDMIEAEALAKRYGDKEAVRGLNLRVRRGELYCFLGPNGAGKTTTIKMLCGLLRPSAGHIRVAGLSLSDDAVNIRKLSGYIPDTPYLYERLTTTEFFEFIGRLYGIPREAMRQRYDELFDLFGLLEHKAMLVRELSHGLRQRLVYASTLLQDPQVLFIDEPFVGLDPYTIRLIRTLLREKTAAGMTVFLTTHILALAEDMADRIGIIANGELVAEGTMEELRSQTRIEGRLEDLFLQVTAPSAQADRIKDEVMLGESD